MTSIELSLGKIQNSKHFYCTYSKRQTIVSVSSSNTSVCTEEERKEKKLSGRADKEETWRKKTFDYCTKMFALNILPETTLSETQNRDLANQQYTKYTSMMLCKQTLMCFEDFYVGLTGKKKTCWMIK